MAIVIDANAAFIMYGCGVVFHHSRSWHGYGGDHGGEDVSQFNYLWCCGYRCIIRRRYPSSTASILNCTVELALRDAMQMIKVRSKC